MRFLDTIRENVVDLLPAAAVVVAIGLGLWLVNWLLIGRRRAKGAQLPFARQVLMLILTAVALFVALFAIPMSDDLRTGALTVITLALTVILSMSSTTFAANIMAGLMLRLVRSFKVGDFLRVDEAFGRVTERGLFHTEIQTEDRDLTTFPNLYLVTRPYKVVRASGTIVSAEVSLGYDVARNRVEKLLLEAAEKAGLQEPYVHLRDLGDHSITYRAAGFLTDVKRLISMRSTLREQMLDHLHGDGVEIVSPTFMNQRRIDQSPVIADYEPRRSIRREAESIVFDKADRAQQLEKLGKKLAELQKELGEAKDEDKARLEREIEQCQAGKAELETELQREEEETT